MSFLTEKVTEEGMTFDDVLLIPAYSEVTPNMVNVQTRFSRNISLNIPVVSAAMDTVTEAAMAIAIARQGGIGVIHKNMPIEAQAAQVRKVKRAESGMIFDPVTITPSQTVGDAQRMMHENHIGGIPVVDNEGKLVGIVTNRDLRFQTDESLPDSRGHDKGEYRHDQESRPVRGITDIASPQDREASGSGQRQQACRSHHVSRHHQNPGLSQRLQGLKGRLRVAAGVGVTSDTINRVEALVNAGVDAVVIDTAHGHSANVVNTLKAVKAKFPEIDVLVGNIATAEAAEYLISNGADGIKVGIGPGSICTTRIVAGVGVPQLSAIFNCCKVAAKHGVPVIGDGGLRYSGDVVKAIAAGADCVMMGSMLAGTEESPGETIIYNGRKFKAYRGMGSIEAMQAGSKDRYFQSETCDSSKFVPEGIVARVPYKGTLAETIYQLLGGLRSGMGYCGAKDIATLHEAKFVRITSAGVIENHPHDVTITKEAPNYSRGE